ncbi:hypothetical protein FAM21823_02214 [Lentilactobacillus parabuchneri]|uniref:hypothetical protein n=1 Tax=Lentilactobacillus parabuchneri TaxID=152331 RepID=UPI000A10244D|nr:hypothetical protein [Lentilactobacillus parabuchneri]ORM99219.1 hypothetical protein FAM21823_02214 [Lentilactobacillus parabuchneri]
MATPNVGILTNAGKNLIDQVNAGQTKITFSKIVFSSMDNSQLTDDQIKALTAITPQEVVVNSPEVTLDTNTGETRIRATGNNEALTDGVYVKTYAVYAKDDSGNEILYGLTVSPNPNYLPEYDGVTPQVVTYSYKVNISNTSNITFSNSDDIYVSDTDLTEELQPYAKTVDVNQQLDKKVNVADMRKPASDVAGIEEVNAKQDKIGYTPADDSKVVHLSGANNFDTVPTVNNNPLLLASSLPSDLARTGSDQEFTGKNTFDTAPIDKTTGNPYITKDGVPAVPSTLADTTKLANFTAGLQSGGVSVATSDDLKSVEASAWRQLDSSKISVTNGTFENADIAYKIFKDDKYILLNLFAHVIGANGKCIFNVDLSSIITSILSMNISYAISCNPDTYSSFDTVDGVTISGSNTSKINVKIDDYSNVSSQDIGISFVSSNPNENYAKINYADLV